MVADNQKQAYITSAKYYMVRAFPEKLKSLSSKLMMILTFKTTYVVRFGM